MSQFENSHQTWRELADTPSTTADDKSSTDISDVYQIVLKEYTLDECAIELGLYFVLLTLCMFVMLDQVRGKPAQIRNWLLWRKLEIFKNDDANSDKVANFLWFASLFYIAMPFLTLLGWFVLLAYDKIQEEQELYGPICVLIVGVGFIAFGYNSLRLKWMNYRVKRVNLIIILVCVLLLTFYQCLVIFGISFDHQEKFFPYSALFLNFNVTLLGALIYFSKYKGVKDISYVLEKFFPETGNALDKDRDVDLQEELQQQKDDPSYNTSKEELIDLITIHSVSEEKYRSVIGEGSVQAFNKMKPGTQGAVKGAIIGLSYVILIFYAYILYKYDDENPMGIITSVSVALMDFFNFLLYQSEMVDSPAQVVGLLIINRILMVSLGQDFWIYGYVILYVLYGLVFVFQIARNRFPFEDDVVLKHLSLKEFLKGSKKPRTGPKKPVSLKEATAPPKTLGQKLANPEILLFILTIFAMVLMFVIKFSTGAKVSTIEFTIDAPDSKVHNEKREFAITQVAGYAILFLLAFYFIVASFRLLIRKKRQVQNTGQSATDSIFAKLEKYATLQTIYIIVAWIFNVIWSYILWNNTGIFGFISFGIFGTAAVWSFSVGFVYFSLNEYQVFQDIKKLNKWIDRHNRKIDEMEERKAKIQQDLADGNLLLPPVPKEEEDKPTVVKPQPPAPSKQVEDGENLMVPGADQAEEEAQPQPDPGNTADDEAAAAAEQARQQEELREMMRQEQERKKAEQEARASELAANEELRLKQEQEAEEMREQQRLEAEQAAAEKAEAERRRQKQIQEQAERQRKEEAKRREQNNKVSNSTVKSYTGQMQQAEIVSRRKGYKDDEMYEGGDTCLNILEGGDAGDPVSPSPLPSEQRPGDLDLDETNKDPNGAKLIARSRVKRVADWRLKQGKSWFKAFQRNMLRPNDMYIIYSCICALVAWFGMAISLFVQYQSMIGLVYTFPFVYVGATIIIGSSVIYQSRTFTKIELGIWGLVNVLYLALGVGWFVYDFELKDFDFGNSCKAPVTQAQKDQVSAANFFFAYILLAPTLAHGVVIALRFIDVGQEGFKDQAFKIMIALFGFGLVLMIFSTFLLVCWKDGIAFLCVVLVVLYAVFQVSLYIKNDGYMEVAWKRINLTIIILGIFAAGVVSIFDDNLSTFEGITYSLAVTLFLLWSFALFHFIKDSNESTNKPVYYAGALFPVYKFNPRKNDVNVHYEPLACWLIGLSFLTLWGFYMNTSIEPQWMGAIVTIGIELVILMSAMYLRSLTMDSLKNTAEQISPEIARAAWLETKQIYYKTKGAFSRQELVTYRKTWIRRFQLQSYIKLMQKKKIGKPPKSIKKEIQEEVNPGSADRQTQLDFFRDKVEDFLPDKYDIESRHDLSYYSYVLDQQVHDTALEEIECIVQFIMMTVQNTQIKEDQKRKEYLRFMQNKLDVLHALGIEMLIPASGSLFQRCRTVEQQVEEMEPSKQKIFKQLELLYKQEMEQKAGDSAAAKAVEQAKQDERANIAAEMRKNKDEALAALGETVDIDITADLDSMPDCLPKYKIIVERAKQTGEKFTDAMFPPNDESMGPDIAERTGGQIEWQRMSEHNGGAHVLFEDGVDTNDVMQGQMGDCYFLSAIAVLGSAQTRDKFVLLTSDDEFAQCGAFCVRFYDGGKEDIVIIDDHLPLLGGDFFGVTTPTGKELWPQILEKAYAKKYGSYTAIEGGLVHIALGELTNGIPEIMNRNDNQNLKKWWDQLMSFYKSGFKLGAGSPSHPDGDSATSDTGIVQGHAYSVLKLMEVDGKQLICLRNPWGQGEWTGDWSDDSELWTTRMKNLTGQKDFAEDGIFWMDFNDFVVEFDDVYICKEYKFEEGWTNKIVFDSWEGDYAEGLPHSKNREAKMVKNPQYGITATKPGKGVIVLRLKEKKNAYLSIQSAYLNVQKKDGELIDRPDKKNSLGTCGPTPYVLQYMEVEFENNLRYPYTFSAICANMNHGADGEGNYSMQVYSKDEALEITKLN